MKKNIIIATLLVGMIIWTIVQTFDSDNTNDQQQTTPISDGSSGEVESGTATGDENTADQQESSAEIGIKKGDMAPDFELSTIDGEVAKLSDFRGQKIMLNFWATWCPPCRAEMPDMQQVYEENDIMVLAVNLTQTETGVESVEIFVEEFGLTFPILLDERIEVADQFGIQPVPTSFMIDTKGRIHSIAIGPMNEAMMLQRFNEMD